MRRNRRAKIVATLGPSCSDENRIRELVQAGVDVFRFNFSHGDYDGHIERLHALRRIEEELHHPIAALMDLQGPKLRVGRFADGGVELEKGDIFRFDMDDVDGDQSRVCLPHPEIFSSLREGANLLLDDGKIRMEVVEFGAAHAELKVLTGGKLSNNKGVNLPDVNLNMSPLTPKDRRDLEFGLEQDFDWIALSFVQRAADMAEARNLVGTKANVLAKLEKPSALDELDEIVDLSHGIMVARGDLGVEVPPERVPAIQKRVIRACRRAGKPVIVATQMLESMIKAPAPTRAEASDVATAIYDGSDAVMLSGETAIGDYPVEAVSIMENIIVQTEKDPILRDLVDASKAPAEDNASDAISAAAREVAHTLDVRAIVTFSMSGKTGYRVSRERPEAPIVGVTTSKRTARQMTLAWGLLPVVAPDVHSLEDMVDSASRAAARASGAEPGDRMIITAGIPFGHAGATNLVHIATISEEHLFPRKDE